MSLIDGQDLFGSGPHSFRELSWQRQQFRRGFAGVSGELVMDMGLRSRQVVQAGRLQAQSAGELQAVMEQIERLIDGKTHVLEDNHGRSFRRVIVEHFEPETPLARGRGFWCDYTIRYRQLP